jgi:hypothetical protein
MEGLRLPSPTLPRRRERRLLGGRLSRQAYGGRVSDPDPNNDIKTCSGSVDHGRDGRPLLKGRDGPGDVLWAPSAYRLTSAAPLG